MRKLETTETLTGGNDQSLVAGSRLQRRALPQEHLTGGGVDGEEAVRDPLASSGSKQVVAHRCTGTASVATWAQGTRETQIFVLRHRLVHDAWGILPL